MDEGDYAKDWQNKFEARALAAHRASRPAETAHEMDGVRLCLDCGDEIPPLRLQARPEAVRCAECQGYWEVRASRGI